MAVSCLCHGLKIIFVTLVLLLSGQCLTTYAVDDSPEITTSFFEGDVVIIKIHDHATRFYLVGSDTTVFDVRNDMYLRMVDNLHNPPKSFKILAPMTAVSIVAGDIPQNLLKQYTLQHYLELREQYERKFIVKEPFSVKNKIVRTVDIHRIWTLRLDEWTDFAQTMVHPDGWKPQLFPERTGTIVMFFDSNSSMGLSIRPFYRDTDGPPEKLVIDSYFPRGALPEFTEPLKTKIEQEEAADLGPDYSVTATHTALRLIEVIKLIIAKAE